MKRISILTLFILMSFFTSAQIQNTRSLDSIPESKTDLDNININDSIIAPVISFIDSLKAENIYFELEEIYTEEKKFYLGEDSIAVLIHWKSNNGLTYFNMHDDENICVEEGLKTLEITGGKLVEVKHYNNLVDKARYISFKEKQKIYTFDPNRIFTNSDSIRAKVIINRRRSYQAENVLKSLKAAQIPTPEECLIIAQTTVKNFADTLIKLIDTSHTNLLIALHNNKGIQDRCELSHTTKKWEITNGSYSMNSYIRRGTIENLSCSDIYINPRSYLSGFFIVLKKQDFMHLVEHRCNAILQNDMPIDDGSLSVFASFNGIDYMNIEAKFNNKEEQKLLLDKVKDLWQKRQNKID